MTRKSTTLAITEIAKIIEAEAAIEEANELLASVAQPEAAETPTAQEILDDAEIDAQIKLTNSVVKPGYKLRYKEKARAAGNRAKWAKRSTGDWLAACLAANVLDKQSKIDIAKLTEIAKLNGIDDPEERWPNRSKGWEGRYRMTIGLVLRPMVADAGVLLVPDEEGHETLEAPAEWVLKYRT
jgi:hypothetical protein